MLWRREQSCADAAVAGAASSAVMGAAIGGGSAALQCANERVPLRHAAAVVLRSAFSNSLYFMVGIGVYRGAYCVILKERRRRDFLNPLIAGAISGAVVALPHAFMSRNPRSIAVSAAVSAALFTTLDVLMPSLLGSSGYF
jgi:hypothetical protein